MDLEKIKKTIRKKNILCTHNRRKNRCKECGGVSICPHQRRKNFCIEC